MINNVLCLSRMEKKSWNEKELVRGKILAIYLTSSLNLRQPIIFFSYPTIPISISISHFPKATKGFISVAFYEKVEINYRNFNLNYTILIQVSVGVGGKSPIQPTLSISLDQHCMF